MIHYMMQHTPEQELNFYKKVNQTKDLEQLSEVMREIADENGMIQGREKCFSVEKMIIGLNMFMKDEMPPNVLTREFGIRQQAIYLKEVSK